MTKLDRAWIAGVIWMGLGVAYDQLVLTCMATLMFLFTFFASRE